MDTTEKEAITNVTRFLEAELSSDPDHREQLAASDKAKVDVSLTQVQV